MSIISKTSQFSWPREPLTEKLGWSNASSLFSEKPMNENLKTLSANSQWPAFFSSPMCIVNTYYGKDTIIEKVVGPSIVNRFPYIMALSFCKKHLSERHFGRDTFIAGIEKTREVSVQFFEPGDLLDVILAGIESNGPDACYKISDKKHNIRSGISISIDAIAEAYMVYEGRLVKPGKDFHGNTIFEKPFMDIGSHRIYYFEITGIQLRSDIANGKTQINWQALAKWRPNNKLLHDSLIRSDEPYKHSGYVKSFTPNYFFPSRNTIAFKGDGTKDKFTYKLLPPLAKDQVEVDNDRARWPCFFPSSLGLISTYSKNLEANIMPCGSTTVVSRHPFTIAVCISYANINERYAPRATLSLIRENGHFGCGVGYIDDAITKAICFLGTTSLNDYPKKAFMSGLKIEERPLAPLITTLPIHFECKVISEQKLGTHIIFYGEVVNMLVRKDLTIENPLEWNPWSELRA